MKQNFFLFLALLCPLLSFAQFANQEYITAQKEWGKTNTLLTANGQTYVGGYYFECPGPLLYALDYNNELLWFGELEAIGGVHDLDFNPATNALAGSTHHDEFSKVSGIDNGPAIFSFDENGNNIFTTILDVATYGISPNYPTSITHTNNGGWVVTANENLIWFSSTGELLNIQTFDESMQFKKIEWVDENQLVAITLSNLLVIDHDGNTLQIENFPDIQSVYSESGKIYCLTETELIAYDPSDQSVITTSDYLTNIESPQGICGNSSSLFVYEKNNDNADFEKVIQMDITTLQYMDEFYFEQENTELNEVVANEDNLFIGGSLKIYNPLDVSTQYDIYSGRSSFIKTTPVFGAPSFFGSDIGISNFLIVDPLVPIDTVEIDYSVLVYFQSPYINVTYDLTNHGLFPITAFNLLSNRIAGAIFCVDLRVYQNQSNYIIPPGETITISDSLFILNFIDIFYLQSLEISLSTFAPNYYFDGDISNNFALMQGSLVNAKEPKQLSGISVSPNPTTEQLNIDFETTYPDANLLIYDIFGKMIHEQTVDNHSQLNIMTTHWPSGTYILVVKDKNKLFTEQVLKF